MVSSKLPMEKFSKRGGSATKGNKRIVASQTPEGDYDLALSLQDVPEAFPALSTAKGTKKPTASTNERANQRPPDGISIQPRTKRPSPGLPAARCTRSRQLALQSPAGYETSSYGSATSQSKRRKIGQSPAPRRSSLQEHSLVQGHALTDTELTDESTETHNAAEDAEGDDLVGRGQNMGRGPKRLSRPLRGKLPVVIPKGKTRPESALIAAKFARECNNVVTNHVHVRSHWNQYKGDTGLLGDYYGEVASKFVVDINVSPVKTACTKLLQKGLRQCRYLLKKEFFYKMDRPIPEESPVASMNNDEWNALVEHWSDPQTMKICAKNKDNCKKVQFHQATGSRSYAVHLQNLGNEYKDKEPTPLEIFKECHFSRKNGFSTAVQDAIAEMEKQLSEPTADGGRKSEAQVVSEVLSKNTAKPSFLRNVGLIRSSGSKMSDLVADLEIEKRGSAELLDVVNTQRDQMDELSSKVQEGEKNRADMEARIEELREIMLKQR